MFTHVYKTVNLQLWPLITNSSGCNVDEITSFMNCGLAYKCEMCLNSGLSWHSGLGNDQSRGIRPKKKGCWLQFAVVHLFSAYGYLMSLTEAPASCDIQGHIGLYIMPISRSTKSQSRVQELRHQFAVSAITVLCTITWLPRTRCIKAAVRPQMHKTHVRTIICKFHINTASCSLLWVLSTEPEVTKPVKFKH